MSTLQRLMNEKRADLSDAQAHASFVTKLNPTVLAVLTSTGPAWLLSWTHFAFARFEPGHERDSLTLRFVAVEVTARGLYLASLQEPIVELRLALLRVAPTRYQKASVVEPFIDSLRVEPLSTGDQA